MTESDDHEERPTQHSRMTTTTDTETPMTTDRPTIDIPEYRDLTKNQALAIIDEWGTPAIDVSRDRRTASISTPPLSVEQIAVIVLQAAQRATSVSSYVLCCAKNNGSDPAPDVIRDRVGRGEGMVQYRARLETLQQIVDGAGVEEEE